MHFDFLATEEVQVLCLLQTGVELPTLGVAVRLEISVTHAQRALERLTVYHMATYCPRRGWRARKEEEWRLPKK